MCQMNDRTPFQQDDIAELIVLNKKISTPYFYPDNCKGFSSAHQAKHKLKDDI